MLATYYMIWLVVWNMHFMTFHIIGNNDPKWLVFFRGVGIPPTTLGFLGTLPIKSLGSTVNTGIQNVGFVCDIPFLVGGLEHEFYDFPFSWEVHNPNWRSHIFQRGRSTTNQLWIQLVPSERKCDWGVMTFRGSAVPSQTLAMDP